jgi:hypothetical protein
MAKIASEVLFERLADWGVDTIFGLPGDGINGINGIRLVNPDEPPMPGKVEYEQANGFVKAFLAGQPRKATIASPLFRDEITEMRA